MLTREELCFYDCKNPPKHGLGRKKHIEKKYEEKFKDTRNKDKFIDSINNILKQKKYHFVENDFPYDIEEGIKHMVCWYKNENIENIIQILKGKYTIITYWENLSQNKSIMHINHIHIFILE